MAKRTVIPILYIILSCLFVTAQDRMQQQQPKTQKPKVQITPTAWRATEPLGLREWAAVDTMELNYYQRSVPSAISSAFDCTGNLGCPGKNMIFMEQPAISDFFLADAYYYWLPFHNNHLYFNTGEPITQLAYNTGGGRDNSQDRLTTIFSANINSKAQFGANLDYLYSKGSYANQAAKHLGWGLSGSYIGDRFEFQGSWYHFNSLNKENGGITDPLYITDPAQLQGGISSINPKSIPTNLSHASNRLKGGELFLNSRYKVGFWKETRDSVNTDSVIYREYIPVSSFIWTLNYNDGSKAFIDSDQKENDTFWENTYLSPSFTEERTDYWRLTNTVGISMLEGFNKYAKFGLAAFAKYEIRHYTQVADTLDRTTPDMVQVLTPLPDGCVDIPGKTSENLAWIGGELSKQNGSILTYGATAEFGVIGRAIGEVKAKGHVRTHIPLFGDTVSITGYGSFYNTSPHYLLNNYISNHFAWHNDFGKERRLRLGGVLDIPWTSTTLDVGTETMQNTIYFGEKGMPLQNSGSVQVFSAQLKQHLQLGILNWDNQITYQTSTDSKVVPLPALAVYSNLYLKCRIATLKLQLGVDCDYYTKYYAPAYQPATATFHNQNETKIGNYPFMNAYANMKLGRVRFYVMMSHVNQGLFGGSGYFSSPNYPLNPRRLQLGLSVDFIN